MTTTERVGVTVLALLAALMLLIVGLDPQPFFFPELTK